MELYETDMDELKKFMETEKKEEFRKEYLILYDFAVDCQYSKNIQPELIRYLLPFYLKAIQEAILYKNKIAIDIYLEFNSAIFFNQRTFRYAVGERNYQYIMEYYIQQTLKKMEMKHIYILEWVSLFNTTIAFCDNNIKRLFPQIFKSSLKIKYSFFQYLSVLLFKESDNLLAANETHAFWTSDIWDFDDGCSLKNFFWSDNIVRFFNKEINKERIITLLKEIKPFLYNIFESDLVELLYEEINQSFVTGVFSHRKAEFLQKINNTSEQYKYWDATF